MFTKQITTRILFAASLFLIGFSPVDAQQTDNQPAQTAVEIKNADVAITANVTARELKFETVPNPKVEFPGNKERVTVWEADRQNLPKPVEPGVTYRNIGIRLRIISRFADIERIVAEALGETPISNKVSPDNKSVSPAQSNSANKNTPR